MFCHLVKRKHHVVPKVSYNKENICSINELLINETDVSDHVKSLREMYAKTALIMFYPFRCIDGLLLNDKHWDLFKQQLDLKKPTKIHCSGITVFKFFKIYKIKKLWKNATNVQQIMSQKQQWWKQLPKKNQRECIYKSKISQMPQNYWNQGNLINQKNCIHFMNYNTFFVTNSFSIHNKPHYHIQINLTCK